MGAIACYNSGDTEEVSDLTYLFSVAPLPSSGPHPAILTCSSSNGGTAGLINQSATVITTTRKRSLQEATAAISAPAGMDNDTNCLPAKV